MRHLLSTIFFLGILIGTQQSFSQTQFEEGYFVSNNGKRTECQIENKFWKNNPQKFQYTLTQDSQVEEKSIDEVSEFGVSNVLKYVRVTVDMDRSGSAMSDLTDHKEPDFNEETLFLKVLIEGKANLYMYEDNAVTRFFYSLGEGKISQLIYKSYKTLNGSIGYNNFFKQQLWAELQCTGIDYSTNTSLRYNKHDLVKYFGKYNTCTSSDFVNYEENVERDLFSLSIKPGLNSSSLSFEQDAAYGIKDLNFDSNEHIQFGVELELFLPFNNNKWSIKLEPTYQKFNSEREIVYVDSYPIVKSTLTTISYTSLQMPLGLRYYIFFNEKSGIFFNGSFLFDVPLKAGQKIDFETNEVDDLDINVRPGLAFGIGYKYSRFGVEVRYNLTREFLGRYASWTSDYTFASAALIYTVF